MKKGISFSLIVFFVLVSIVGYSLKNVCHYCGTMATLDETICKKCQRAMNECLDCGMINTVSVDFCASCTADMAEMRILGTIDPETRDDLRLGKSDRAQLERSLQRLTFKLEKEPDNAEIINYRIAKIYQQMAFYSREAQCWKEYLEKFPSTKKREKVLIYQSEALRQWGYLFYQQKKKNAALEKYLESAAINPGNAESWLWAGRIYNETKEPVKAAEAYLNALKAKPGDSTAIHFLRKAKKTIPAELLKPVKIAPKLDTASPTTAINSSAASETVVTSEIPVTSSAPVASEPAPAVQNNASVSKEIPVTDKK
ncbi:MAG: tetratricopeptide repeat protein [Candidatus Riflebacteria bacterium]|nr:tetratricopeptide repeat protein [Candidatus Riflebacteria bacterium]